MGGCGGSKSKPQVKKSAPVKKSTGSRPSGGGLQNIGSIYGTPKVKFGARR